MSFDIKALDAAVDAHGPVIRVVIAEVAGSSPREVGAAMIVWGDGQSGTIGGGTLEHDATQAARAMLAGHITRQFTRHALGPDLGQCCGGRVSLLMERFDADRISGLPTDAIARPASVDTGEMPLSVTRVLAAARNRGAAPEAQLRDGWMIEPVARPTRGLWIWGAGHVGRALIDVLAPLPDLALTWIDTGAARFPPNVPAQVTVIPQENPGDLVRFAPPSAEHLIVTYSHALDLALCHALLSHGFGAAGLIGSATKWARFRKRLAELGHGPEQIARIACPIGDPSFGKHPAQIAVSVAAGMLARGAETAGKKESRA